MSKAFYFSKTFWVNLIALIVLAVQTQTGYVVAPEIQVAALSLINVVLRAITRQPITWS